MCIFSVKLYWVINMVYYYKDLMGSYGSDYQIRKAVNENKLYKLEPGIYSDKEKVHYLELFTRTYPNAIISGDSAYYYHNLTDVIPSKIYMTTSRSSSIFNDDSIVQSYKSDDTFEIGKTNIDFEGVKINIYDRERMLVELVRNKNSTPYDYYKEIINNYRKIKEELSIYKIQEYANIYSNNENIIARIQDEVF